MARHRTAALALAAGAAFLLEACAPSKPMHDEPMRDGPWAAAPPAALSSAGGPGGGTGDGPGAPFVAAAITAVPAPPMRLPRSARDLAGLTDGELVSAIGEPDLKRSEDGAEAWLYRSPSCVLDVFLEAGEAERKVGGKVGGEPRVVLATARPLGAADVPEEACLRSLARVSARLRPTRLRPAGP